jgi:hypothetical protein
MTRSDDADRMIREALEREEAGALEAFGEPTMAGDLMEAFRGRNRRLAIGGVVANLALTVAVIYAAVRFFGTGEVRTMLVWGAAAFACFALVLAIKVWYWLEVARLSVVREVKRLELQVSRLAEGVGEGGR